MSARVTANVDLGLVLINGPFVSPQTRRLHLVFLDEIVCEIRGRGIKEPVRLQALSLIADGLPLVLQDLARELATAHVTSDVGRPPPGYPIDMDARRQAIKEFADSLRSGAEIDVYVATATE